MDNVAREIEDARNFFTECKNDHSNLECVQKYAKKKVYDFIDIEGKVICKIFGDKVGNYIMMIPEVRSYMDECKKNHRLLSCTVGAIAYKGTSTATSFMSGALILVSPTVPVSSIPLSLGLAGVLNSDKIGKSFGDLSSKIIDYLMDKVPVHMIDTSKPIILRSNNLEIELSKKDVKIITNLVKINQYVDREVKDIEKKFGKFIGNKENTRDYVFGTMNDIKQLEFEKYNLLKPIKSVNIVDKLSTDYIKANKKIREHNSGSNGTVRAFLEYSSNKEWKISFSIGYSFGNNKKGGGFCVIL